MGTLRSKKVLATIVAWFLVLMASSTSCSAKGRVFSYTMTGVAYDKSTKTPLSNTTLIIGHDTVTTDADGRYTVSIGGATCDRGGGWMRRRCNESSYGKLVLRRLGGAGSTRIKSHWRTYAFCDREKEPTCGVYRRDLLIP